MGSRAFGELLLRPSTFTRVTPAARFTTPWAAQRCISNTSSKPAAQRAHQERPEMATTPEVAAESPKPTSQDAAAQAIDSLFSPSSSPDSAAPTDSMNRAQRVFGAAFSPSQSSRGPRSKPHNLKFDQMVQPESIANPSLANKPAQDSSVFASRQNAIHADYPRLNPTYGRTVDLDPSRGRDLVRGIGMLGSLMARNKIKREFNKQRFHERGGLKRKRLNSERWRARFKKGFQDVTGRVMELTRKGW